MAKNSGKAPSIQFYFKDFIAKMDGEDPEIVGAWMLVLCKIWHEKKGGSVNRTLRQFAKIMHTDEVTAKRFICHFASENIANVTEGNGRVTITNRRTKRDTKLLEQNRLRQQRHREKLESNADVTTQKGNPSSSNSNSSSNSLSLELNKQSILFDDKLQKLFGDLTKTERVTFRKIRLFLVSLRDLEKFKKATAWIAEVKQWGEDHDKNNVEVKKCYVSKIKKLGWKKKTI